MTCQIVSLMKITTCNKDSLGQNPVYIAFLNNFPLFSKIFINIDEYANRIIYLHVRPFHRMKVIYISFNLLANLIE